MHPRLYRLIETHQRIDDALRREQRRGAPDLIKLLRLKQLRLRTKQLIASFSRKAAQV